MSIDHFIRCQTCQSFVDTFHGWGENGLCQTCERAAVHDDTVFPYPEHMRRNLERYIQWREDTAVAKHVLEQAERL